MRIPIRPSSFRHSPLSYYMRFRNFQYSTLQREYITLCQSALWYNLARTNCDLQLELAQPWFGQYRDVYWLHVPWRAQLMLTPFPLSSTLNLSR